MDMCVCLQAGAWSVLHPCGLMQGPGPQGYPVRAALSRWGHVCCLTPPSVSTQVLLRKMKCTSRAHQRRLMVQVGIGGRVMEKNCDARPVKGGVS